MKKSYYCEKLNHSLNLLPDRIAFCCSCAEGCHFLVDDYNNLDFNKVHNKRNEYIEQMNNGIIPNECSGCCEYKENKEYEEKTFLQKIVDKLFNKKECSDKRKINYIIINHFKQCECNCVYCAQKILYPMVKQKFEILPFIKELYAKNLIDEKDHKIEFQGGNVSLLNEFDSLVEEFCKHNAKQYFILTNGINKLPTLERIKDKTDSVISISLDSGTAETFKRIKNVDAFDKVIKNIREIRQNTKLTVSLKYIIIEGINDNIEELSAFLNMAKELEINGPIILEIDYRKLFMNSPERMKIPQLYYDMYEYAETFCKNNNIGYNVLPYTKQVLDRGYNFQP